MLRKATIRRLAWLFAIAGTVTMGAAEGPGVGLATGLLFIAGYLFLESW
jgi:hypothetical protein